LTYNLKIIKQGEIVLGSTPVPYIVKRSLRAKLIWLTVKKQTGLTITVPRYYNIQFLESYLFSKSNWILSSITKMNNQKRILEKNICSNTVPYLGTTLNILKRTNDIQVAEIKLEQNQLIVDLDPCFFKQPAVEVELWLKNQAAININQKTKDFSLKMGLFFNKITIRSQKSRWGSCSRNKNLSFNWRLIMTPEPILDYVVIHELSHLKEMNHSKKFWDIVSDYCPGWKECRKWLTQHSSDLGSRIRID
jgi:predicted metal-dependent hydrolase